MRVNLIWDCHRKWLEISVRRNQCPARVSHASIGHKCLVLLGTVLGIVRVVRNCVVETTGSSQVLSTVYSCTSHGYAIVWMFRRCSLYWECSRSIHKWSVHCFGFYATQASWWMGSFWACCLSWIYISYNNNFQRNVFRWFTTTRIVYFFLQVLWDHRLLF